MGSFELTRDGSVNALRFITKNILAVLQEKATTIDWLIDYLVLPLHSEIQGKCGDKLQVTFEYTTGASIRSLENSLQVTLLTTNKRN
jgi:protein arginine N-methyltransferase 1